MKGEWPLAQRDDIHFTETFASTLLYKLYDLALGMFRDYMSFLHFNLQLSSSAV